MKRLIALLSLSLLALLPGCSLLVGGAGTACTEADDCGPGLRCGAEGACVPADCEDACPTVGRSCQEDVLHTCHLGADGCLEETLTDCAQSSQSCVDDGSTAGCEGPCSDACSDAGLSCDGNDLVTCATGISGCLEASSTPCPEPTPICHEDAGSASCVSCSDQCAQEGISCEGDTLVLCTPASDGCLDRTDTDCLGDGTICFNSACVAPDATCDSGEIDGHETDRDCGGPCPPCPIDDGCMEHADCQSGYCDPGGHVCKSVCSDDCTETDPDQCDGSAIQACQLSDSGCWLWTTTSDCADDTQICQNGACAACEDCSSAGAGARECLGSLSRSCESVGGGQCWIEQECSLTGGDTCSDTPATDLCVEVGLCGTYHCNPRAPGFADMRDDSVGMTREFTDGQPVVIDANRGLMWQGCIAGFTGEQCDGGSAVYKTWSEAVAYCRDLSWGPDAGSPFDDWYLPDRYEMQSILQYQGSAWIDASIFPAPGSFDLWTANTDRSIPSQAWFVDSGTGQIELEPKEPGSGGNYVRCVRRISPAVAYQERFIMDAGRETITDRVTGLIWQSCTSGYTGSACAYTGPENYTFAQAPTYCGTLNLGDQGGGWRLPSAKELNSIVDDTRSPRLDDTVFFVNGTHDNLELWSSDQDALGRGFVLAFGTGHLRYDTGGAYSVRCVHDP